MPHHSFGREVANVLLRVIAVIATFVVILGISSAWMMEAPISDGTCNIAVLPLQGVIAPYGDFMEGDYITTPDDVRTFIESAEEDFGIEGILVEVNSPGGTPVAAESIAELFANSSLPTVGLIGDMGASGGYLVAAATDYLIASPMSNVGAIGVTMSYLEETKKNEEEGLTFVDLSAGKFKEAGNPNKPLTAEERARFEKDLNTVHQEFISLVAKYRDVPTEDIKAIADGGSYTGKDALEKKLVDALGGRAIARAQFAETLGVSVDEVSFCEYVPAEWWI